MSENGSNCSDFHKYFDNKGPTLILIKTNNNRIFGGFTPLNWVNQSVTLNDGSNKTFIFSLNLMKKFDIFNKDKEAIICNSNSGPNFGETDFSVKDYNANDCIVSQYNRWDGTSLEVVPVDNTYYITDPRQLAWISDQVNSGNSFEGKNVVLLTDINFGANFERNGSLNSGFAFTPIGVLSGYEFKGNFDGNNHKISNLYIKETGNSFTGLFGRFYGTEFKNLIVEDSYIYGELNDVGIIGGNSSGAPALEINNVKSINNIIVSKGNGLGGIVGQLSFGNIYNCYSNSTVVC